MCAHFARKETHLCFSKLAKSFFETPISLSFFSNSQHIFEHSVTICQILLLHHFYQFSNFLEKSPLCFSQSAIFSHFLELCYDPSKLYRRVSQSFFPLAVLARACPHLEIGIYQSHFSTLRAKPIVLLFWDYFSFNTWYFSNFSYFFFLIFLSARIVISITSADFWFLFITTISAWLASTCLFGWKTFHRIFILLFSRFYGNHPYGIWRF